jgi:mannose-6-phosphate isomerase
MVWGGRRLADVLHKPLPTSESYGESWEISDHPLHRSVVANGPHPGQTLHQLLEESPRDILGEKQTTLFPWLVKFLDASDWLSVQVHPDETCVKRLWPGEGSKTEAWFVVDAAPESRIYAGLLPGVDEKAVRRHLANGTVAECLHQFTPHAGDCLFLPAGTVHAVGGGVLIAEIQQTSDATFRLFDWNRRDAQGKSRALHIEESLACIDWKRGIVNPVRAPGFAERQTPETRQPLVQCPHFKLDFVATGKPLTCGGAGRLGAVIVLAGEGAWDDGEEIATGQAWLLPAAMPARTLRPKERLSALFCTLP